MVAKRGVLPPIGVHDPGLERDSPHRTEHNSPVREDLSDERRRRCQNDGATQSFRQASSRSRAAASGGGSKQVEGESLAGPESMPPLFGWNDWHECPLPSRPNFLPGGDHVRDPAKSDIQEVRRQVAIRFAANLHTDPPLVVSNGRALWRWFSSLSALLRADRVAIELDRHATHIPNIAGYPSPSG